MADLKEYPTANGVTPEQARASLWAILDNTQRYLADPGMATCLGSVMEGLRGHLIVGSRARECYIGYLDRDDILSNKLSFMCLFADLRHPDPPYSLSPLERYIEWLCYDDLIQHGKAVLAASGKIAGVTLPSERLVFGLYEALEDWTREWAEAHGYRVQGRDGGDAP